MATSIPGSASSSDGGSWVGELADEIVDADDTVGDVSEADDTVDDVGDAAVPVKSSTSPVEVFLVRESGEGGK